MKRFSPRAIIFDMDGVIIDSEHLQVEAEKAICKKYGLVVPDSDWALFKGKKNIDIFRYIIDTYASTPLNPEELSKEKGEIYLEIAPSRLTLIPGSMSFIHKAISRFEKLALVTSSGPITQKLAFDMFELHPHFSVVITGRDVVNGKPHPEPYLKAVEQLGLLANECLVIEDSDNGIKAAKSAGCIAVGITTSFERARLVLAGADQVVDTFNELSRVLGFDQTH